jgi:hypothetical protein
MTVQNNFPRTSYASGWPCEAKTCCRRVCIGYKIRIKMLHLDTETLRAMQQDAEVHYVSVLIGWKILSIRNLICNVTQTLCNCWLFVLLYWTSTSALCLVCLLVWLKVTCKMPHSDIRNLILMWLTQRFNNIKSMNDFHCGWLVNSKASTLWIINSVQYSFRYSNWSD